MLNTLILPKLSSFLTVITGFVTYLRVEVFLTQVIQLKLTSTDEFLFTVLDHLCQLPVAELLTGS
jgi:hypothetical protein